MWVTKPAQLVIVGLEVAVYQQGVDANADGMLTDEGDFILYLILNHLRGKRRDDGKGNASG